MPKRTPMTGPRPVGPQTSKNSSESEPSADDYSVANKVMGRSEEPKLQGTQNVIAGSNRGGEGPSGYGGLPQAQPPQFGSRSPDSFSAPHPGRGALPSTMGPTPTDPAAGAYGIVDPSPVVQNGSSLQANFDERFL